MITHPGRWTRPGWVACEAASSGQRGTDAARAAAAAARRADAVPRRLRAAALARARRAAARERGVIAPG